MMDAQGFWCGFPITVSVVSIKPQRSQGICIPSWFIMKITNTIQYTKYINGTASLVEAVSTIQKKCKSTGHYKIQFVSCSCAEVDRSERKKIMKNHRQKRDYEAMKPSKKKYS